MSNSADTGIIEHFQSHFDEVQHLIYGTTPNMTGVVPSDLRARYKDFRFETKTGEELPEAESVHVYAFSRNTWYNMVPRVITGDTVDNNQRRYKLDNGRHDMLAYTMIRQELPMVCVQAKYAAEYEICWIRDLGFNLIESGKLCYGDEQLCQLDSRSIRAHFRIFKDAQYQASIDEQIGNTPDLQNWNTSLPRKTVRFEIPWYYSNDYTLGLPLYYGSTNKYFTHQYVFNNRLGNLLRMRRRVPNAAGAHEIVPVDLKYLHVEDKNDRLTSPEILGMYIKLLPDEVDEYKCWTRANRYGDFYIDDVAWESSSNPAKYGSKVEVAVNNNAITHTIVWTAENRTATENGVHNNYTTNTAEIDKGYDPISKTTLHVGPYDIFKELASEYTSDLFYREFPGRPYGTGLHAWTFCRNPMTINAKMGINMSLMPAKLTVLLRDRNPLLRELDPDTGNTVEHKSSELPEFILHVYMWITRKISFFNDSEGLESKWRILFNHPEFREGKSINPPVRTVAGK